MYYENITVDVAENALPPVVFAKQCDTARGLIITLTERGGSYKPQNVKTVIVNVRKADGKVSVLSAKLNEQYQVQVEFTEQTLAAAGRAVADVGIYDTGGLLLSSFIFFIRVVDAPVPQTKITSTDEYKALADLLVKLTNADEAASVTQLMARKILENINTYKDEENIRIENENARVSAETDRQEAETARATAEAQRKENEAARVSVEEARVAAEMERADAEASRVSSEEIRNDAETDRKTAETARATAEAERSQAEAQRTTAEEARSDAETGRAAAEMVRADAEASRIAAEEARSNAETDRQEAETARAIAETERNAAETERKQAEVNRDTAETERNTAEQSRAQAETDRNIAEIARVGVEAARVEEDRQRNKNEEARIAAETARETAEQSRMKAENQRTTTEEARSNAEDDRQEAETARVSAETDRQEAETARANAEAERTFAEAERRSSEADRVAAEEARSDAEALRQGAEMARSDSEKRRAADEHNRDAAEAYRVSTEVNRTDAEASRATAEEARSDAEAQRQGAEMARSDSEKKRTTAEHNRDTAEAYRVSAEANRAEAESKRTTAETSRINSEVQRTTAENARADAEASRAAAEEVRSAAENARISSEEARAAAENARASAEANRQANTEAAILACNQAVGECEEALEKFNNTRIKKYTVTFNGSASKGVRGDDAADMKNAIAVDAETVSNDFDGISFFNRKICCCTYDAEAKQWRVNAYKGEPGFDWYGENGEVMYENTPFYYATDFNTFVSVTATPCEGYELAPIFKDGESKVYRPVFNMGTVGGKAVSRAGLHPTSGSLNSLMTLARTFNASARTETIEEWLTDWLLMTVEFATKDHQDIIRGACSLPYNNTTRALEVVSTTQFKLTTSQAAALAVGQTLAIGTAQYGENVAARVCITEIKADAEDPAKSIITLDAEAPSLAVDNYVSSRPWKTGAAVLALANASVGSLSSNTDGKHPFVYRGKENPYANAYSTISNILLKRYTNDDGSYRYRAQYLPDAEKYNNGAITEDYIELDFDMPTSDGYAKTFTKDKRYPVIMPSEIGAGSTTYHAAYYYYPRADVTALRVGGDLNRGRRCGSCFGCGSAPSSASWDYVARLSLPTV